MHSYSTTDIPRFTKISLSALWLKKYSGTLLSINHQMFKNTGYSFLTRLRFKLQKRPYKFFVKDEYVYKQRSYHRQTFIYLYIYTFFSLTDRPPDKMIIKIDGHWFEESLPKIANIYLEFLGAEKITCPPKQFRQTDRRTDRHLEL